MEDFIANEDKPGVCQVCNKGLAGRQGKKFCSDQGRAQYHNRRKLKDEKWIHQLNRILRINRTILKTLNPTGHSTVRIEFLKEHGYDDRFFTQHYITAKGEVYYFCYEFGYHKISQEKVLIVNWQNYMKPFNTLSDL